VPPLLTDLSILTSRQAQLLRVLLNTATQLSDALGGAWLPVMRALNALDPLLAGARVSCSGGCLGSCRARVQRL
jgi:modification target Cys-rich repeat protein